MKKIVILIVILPLFFGFRAGEEIDEKKMNRDLEIAKNILVTLIKSGSDSWFGSNSIEASYIRDYGVVFTIPEQLVYFYGGDHLITIPEIPPIPEVATIPDVDVYLDMDVDVDEDVRLDEERVKEELLRAQEQMEMNKEELKRRQAEMEVALAKAKEKELNEFYVTSGDRAEIDWESVMVTFMTDYADLIGQLNQNDKIILNKKSPRQQFIVVSDGKAISEGIENSISAEVLRKDVAAYKSGKIKKEEFIERIKINKVEPQKKIPDLEMFASIFDRFYSRDLSETFYSQNTPRYEVLDGYGAVFHVKAQSPRYSYGKVRYYNRGTDLFEDGERSEIDVESLYPKFREDIKSFLLDYGRTIRSLKDNEKVLLDIRIQACRDCKVPKKLEVSTEISTLKQYDQQKLSKEKAAAQIEIKEVF